MVRLKFLNSRQTFRQFLLFQFLNGAIKINKITQEESDQRNFNSSMVRLKLV